MKTVLNCVLNFMTAKTQAAGIFIGVWKLYYTIFTPLLPHLMVRVE